MIPTKRNRNIYVPTFDKVVNSMNELVCVIGADSRVILANSALTRVTGVQIGDGCPYTECDTECGQRCKFVENAQSTNIEHTRNGRVYTISINPMLDRNGNCKYVSQIWRDITGEYHLRNRLQKQNDSLTNDLQIARSLQHSMLIDKLPSIKNIHISSLYKPCDSVGGDFYDVFKVGKNQALFYMADVSGHGVGAAMLTVFFAQAASQIMHNRTKYIAPDELLRQIWLRFIKLDLEEHLYITAWVAVIDGSNGKLTYCNAGHISSPIVLDASGHRHLETPGSPICRWTEKPEFKNQAVKLQKSSKLLLFTDGLSDALRNTDNKANVYGGINAAEDIAIQHLLNDKLDDCLGNIWNTLMDNIGNNKPQDDVAMLLFEYK